MLPGGGRDADASTGLVLIVYLLPFLLFSGYSGYLADVLSKRTVLIGVKASRSLPWALGAFALITGHMQLMLVVLFMMGLHSTVFSPAKYGIVPEMLPDRDLSRGNALLEMTTLMGIVLGDGHGRVVFAIWKGEAGKMALIPMAHRRGRVPHQPADHAGAAFGRHQRFRCNPYSEVAAGTRHLSQDRPLWLAVLGVAYFWSLGALLKTDLLLFGNEVHAGRRTARGAPDADPLHRDRRWATCWPAGSRATRWNWDWCRWARTFMGAVRHRAVCAAQLLRAVGRGTDPAGR